jgi:hypothetical protein
MGMPGQYQQAQFGQMMGMVNDIVNGKADMSQVAGLLGSFDSRFWKGALVGAAIAFLLTNSTISDSVVGMFSGLWGGGSKEDQTSQDES